MDTSGCFIGRVPGVVGKVLVCNVEVLHSARTDGACTGGPLHKQVSLVLLTEMADHLVSPVVCALPR